ncbi:MAG: type II toxin-antitoxin system RelE/ParE family toxin [Gemmatimonadales bacterium]
MKVVWSPIAEERAAHIVEGIRREDAGAAWRWLQAMLARVRGLSTNAVRGYGVPELDHRPHIGEILFAPYRVIYRIDARRVAILALRSARNPPHDDERDRHHHEE